MSNDFLKIISQKLSSGEVEKELSVLTFLLTFSTSNIREFDTLHVKHFETR